MARLSPAELVQFLAIAEHRNFRKAAVQLGVSASALSHAVRVMEEKLDLRLFNRTTRSVALTEAGERLFQRVKPAFRDIDDALQELENHGGEPAGTLRINASGPASRMVLLPMVGRFLAGHPQVRVEIRVEDAEVDMVSAGFDAGVRFGERLAADMVAIPIGPRQRSAVVASPAFFDRWPKPARPEQLRDLPCIPFRFGSGALYAWEFEKGGIEVQIEVDGPLTLGGDYAILPDAALHGVALAYVFEGQVQAELADGRLVRVLEDWTPYYPGLYLYYPSRRRLPPALRAFVDFVKAQQT